MRLAAQDTFAARLVTGHSTTPLPEKASDRAGLLRLSFLDLIPTVMAILWPTHFRPSYCHGGHLGYGASEPRNRPHEVPMSKEQMHKLYLQAMEKSIRAAYGYIVPDEEAAALHRARNGSKRRRGKPKTPYRKSEAHPDEPVTPLVLKDFELMCFADAMEHEQVTFVTMAVRADDVLIEASPANATRFLLHLKVKHAELSAAEKAQWELRGGELRAMLMRAE